MTFKEQLRKDFIPRLQRIIEKEIDHLKWLMDNNADEKMIESSVKYLRHYKKRHREYTEYVAQLDDENDF